MSNDGSTVVGYCFASGNSQAEKAFIWTPGGGLQGLKELLISQGATNLTGWRLRIAYAVSDDGKTITGAALTPQNSTVAFVAHLGASCPVCAADFNLDGGVTGDDVAAFFDAFENADACADVNTDGGVTGTDVEAFFDVWSAGGC